MLWKRIVPLAILVMALKGIVVAQKAGRDNQQEQTSFSSDAGSAEEFTRRPVAVPASALQILQDTLGRGKINCIEREGMKPAQVPGSWFVASEIHLDGPEEIDLIVRPNVLKLGAHEVSPAASCLLGANVIPFWVLRNVDGRYLLLLETDALRMDVLDSRTNSYRDIQTVASTAVKSTTIVYKMAIAQYQISEKITEP